MSFSVGRNYGFNMAVGAGVGALSAALLKNFQIWKSPEGGRIACLFAERVAANPLNINMGLIISGTAQVPTNYTLTGSLVPGICSFKVLLISCIGLGLLIGACYAYNTTAKEKTT